MATAFSKRTKNDSPRPRWSAAMTKRYSRTLAPDKYVRRRTKWRVTTSKAEAPNSRLSACTDREKRKGLAQRWFVRFRMTSRSCGKWRGKSKKKDARWLLQLYGLCNAAEDNRVRNLLTCVRKKLMWYWRRQIKITGSQATATARSRLQQWETRRSATWTEQPFTSSAFAAANSHWGPDVKCLRKKPWYGSWYGHWGLLNLYGHWWVA